MTMKMPTRFALAAATAAAMALTSSKESLVPPIGPGPPYNPIPEFPNDEIIAF